MNTVCAIPVASGCNVRTIGVERADPALRQHPEEAEALNGLASQIDDKYEQARAHDGLAGRCRPRRNGSGRQALTGIASRSGEACDGPADSPSVFRPHSGIHHGQFLPAGRRTTIALFGFLQPRRLPAVTHSAWRGFGHRNRLTSECYRAKIMTIPGRPAD
jgi:hypothetical protein